MAAIVGKVDDYPDMPWKAFALGAGLAALAVLVDEFFNPGWASNHGPLRDGAAILAAGVLCALMVNYVPSLAGDNVEPYAARVFETWKLGEKGKDNGVLLLGVPKERKLRIEVGYGLAGRLTDAAISRIIRNVIAPSFKAGKFDQGIEEGVAAIIRQLEGGRARQAVFLSFDKNCLRNFATLGATTNEQ
ncbi:MAG TPA: TPM domain-containing protein [Burkholderiales bacterium]|nr:TPM domain-containing protein [Burkholderiales bacterium]